MIPLKFSEFIRLHIWKRLPAILSTVVVSALFFLYYVGILDFSFIERPEGWSEHRVLFSELVNSNGKKPEKEPADTQISDETTSPVTDERPHDDTTKADTDKKEPQKDPDRDTSSLYFSYDKVSKLKEDGYKLSDKIFDDSCVFGTLDTKFSLPEDFTYSWKTYVDEKIVKFTDGTESKVETTSKTEQRPAIELYMGYIIYDDEGVLYLISPDGAVMRQYNDKEFVPAYTRDREGRPLFYRYVTTSEKYPITMGKPDDDGNREWTQTGQLSVKKKEYYYLSDNGQTFEKSDYNDVTDNRGLYFDYPSYYGVMDKNYIDKINADTSEGKKNTENLNVFRYFVSRTRFFTDKDGKTTMEESANWIFGNHSFKYDDYKFDRFGILLPDEEELKKDEESTDTADDKENGKDDKEDSKKTEDTAEDESLDEDIITIDKIFPYTAAYNYSEKYATVLKDIEWSYDHDVKNEEGKTEKKTFDVTTNELRVINENGEIMFDSKKNYFSPSLNWTAHEKYSRPLLSGIESLGHYYFDHGLMRLRVQSWDCYQFAEYDMVRIVTDEEILVDPKGNQFNIPTGYKLISYSNGILLLEKNGRYGYMNYLGAWITEPDLISANPFLEGVAVCRNKNGSYGVIDRDGDIIIPFTYDYISNISGGTLAAYGASFGWTIYQKMAK